MEEILAGGLEDLIRTVKELSPVVWEMTRRHVLVSAVLNLIFGTGLAFLAFVCFRFARQKWHEDVDDTNIFMAALFSTLGCAGFGMFAMFVLYGGLQSLFATDYATLQRLLETIK